VSVHASLLEELQRRVCGVDMLKVMEKQSDMALLYKRSDAYLFSHFGLILEINRECLVSIPNLTSYSRA